MNLSLLTQNFNKVLTVVLLYLCSSIPLYLFSQENTDQNKTTDGLERGYEKYKKEKEFEAELQKNIDTIDVEKLKDYLLQEIENLKKDKLLIPSNDNKAHKKIDNEIDVIQEKIDALSYIDSEQSKQFLGAPVFDKKDFFKLIIKGFFNLLIVLIIVRYIYYPITRNKDYLFTYLLISLTVFLLCFLLDNVKLQLGFALGLFAIF